LGVGQQYPSVYGRQSQAYTVMQRLSNIYGVIRSARDTEDFFFSQLLSVPWVLTRCQPWQRCEEQRACWTHSVG